MENYSGSWRLFRGIEEILREQKLKQKELDKFKKFDELENENKNLKVNLENFLVDKTTKN